MCCDGTRCVKQGPLLGRKISVPLHTLPEHFPSSLEVPQFWNTSVGGLDLDGKATLFAEGSCAASPSMQTSGGAVRTIPVCVHRTCQTKVTLPSPSSSPTTHRENPKPFHYFRARTHPISIFKTSLSEITVNISIMRFSTLIYCCSFSLHGRQRIELSVFQRNVQNLSTDQVPPHLPTVYF